MKNNIFYAESDRIYDFKRLFLMGFWEIMNDKIED